MAIIPGFVGGMVGGAGISVVIAAIDRFSGTFTRAQLQAKKTGVAFNKFATVMKVGSIAAAGAFAFAMFKSIQAAASFQTEITKAMIMFGKVTEAQRNSAEELAITLSKELAISANEAAKAFWFLGSAGLSVDKALRALPATLLFAKVNMLDTASATEFAMTLMKVFSIEEQNLKQALDMTTVAMKSHMLSMGDMAESFTYVASIAKAMGIGIAELSTVVGALADVGIKGSMGGTVLRMALTKLAAPTGEAKTKLKELGIEVYNTDGSMRNIIDIIADMEEALSSATQKERIFTEKLILGQRAFAGFEGLLNLGADRLREYTREVEEADGAMDEMHNTLKEDLNEQFGIFKENIKGTAIELGNAFVPALSNMMKYINSQIAYKQILGDLEKTMRKHGATQKEINKARVEAYEKIWEGRTAHGDYANAVDWTTQKISELNKEYEDEAINLIKVVEAERQKAQTDEEQIKTNLLQVNAVDDLVEEYLKLNNVVPKTTEEAIILNTNMLDWEERFKALPPEIQATIKQLIDLTKTIKNATTPAEELAKKLDALRAKGVTTIQTAGGPRYIGKKGPLPGQEPEYLAPGVTWKPGKKVDDFIIRPGQRPIQVNPEDTIMGFKGEAPTGTTIQKVDIIIQGAGRNGDDIAREVQERLSAFGRPLMEV